MAAESSRKRLRDEVTCAICSDFFAEPVILDCGHNFCRACIAPREGEAAPSCPQCRKALRPGSWRPNRQLAKVAEITKELTEEGGLSCQKHREPLKLFCKDDHSCICLVCGVSREHRDHNLVPAEEAAQEYQVQICHHLENLRKEREKILAYKTETEKESEDLLKQIEAEKQKMVAEFRRLWQFLEDQEKLLLAQMKEVEEEIVKEREEHLARISEPLSSLDGLIRELEEKCQQTASELLQDVRSTLQRCEQKEKFENPAAFSHALKWKVREFHDISPILKKTMTQLKENVARRFSRHRGKLGRLMEDQNHSREEESQPQIPTERKSTHLRNLRQ
ncbi:UNVERIFIED_CONTAM: hypothetical protein K2H54_061098 [Gekko kuhli]